MRGWAPEPLDEGESAPIGRALAFAQKAREAREAREKGDEGKRPEEGLPGEQSLAIGRILTVEGSDDETVAAGILHGARAGEEASAPQLRRDFGKRIATIVETVVEDRRIEYLEHRRRELRERLARSESGALEVFGAATLAAILAAQHACETLGVERHEDDTDIAIERQILLWEYDMELLFKVDGEMTLGARVSRELLALRDIIRRAGPAEEGFVCRAGSLLLLSSGSLEKRAVLREMLTAATAGMDRRQHEDLPEDSEPAWDEGEDDEDEDDEDEGYEDDEEPAAGVGLLPEEAVLDGFDSEESVEDHSEPTFTTTTWGAEMLALYNALTGWLEAAPGGPLEIDYRAGKRSVEPLACGWSSTIVHHLAFEPRSLEDLTAVIGSLEAASVSRFVELLAESGMVEARSEPDGATRYHVTEWLRKAAGALAEGARAELRHRMRGTAPPDGLDLRGLLTLALPLVRLPAELSGTCRLGADLGGTSTLRLAGVTARVESGRVTSVVQRLEETAGAWAVAPLPDWLDALVDPTAVRVKTGGDAMLADALLAGMREALPSGA